MTATTATRKAAKVRKAAMTVFIGGAALSLGANVMASNGTAIGMVVGVVPALMLLGSLYLLENSPKSTWIKVGAGAVALVAGWMSYWHIVEVVLSAGENAVTAHLFPLIIDVPMALASAALQAKVAPVRRAARKAPASRKATTSSPAKLKIAN
jgi:hypothetical protein